MVSSTQVSPPKLYTRLSLPHPRYMPGPSHSSSYSLAAAVSEPALYRLLTFQAQNLMSLVRCLGRTKVSDQVREFVCKCFVTNIGSHSEELLTPRPTPQLEDHPLSAVSYCLFNIFAVTLHI
jgi:hypothetical protein